MTEKPQWRKSYDAVERMLAPTAEALVHSGEFAHLTAALFVVRPALGNGVNEVAARVWHLVNLPAATDVHRLRKQIGALDRDVRRLTLQLELEQAKTKDTDFAVTTDSSPASVIDRVLREVERNALRARNGIRMATGLSRPKLGTTPKDVVWRRGRSELWHYRNDNIRVSPRSSFQTVRTSPSRRWSMQAASCGRFLSTR